MPEPMAGALVVGTEILTGRTVDTNTRLLIATLLERGIRLDRWVVVPDSRVAIGRELVRMIDDGLDIVIVSGGMGPTHDDITVESVAAALGREHATSLDSLARLKAKWVSRSAGAHMPPGATSGMEKMSMVVDGFTTIENPAGAVEGQVGTEGRTRIAILPGVPREYRAIMEDPAFLDLLPDSGGRTYEMDEMVFRGRESQIAQVLRTLQEEHPEVYIGSYPQGPMEVVIRVTGDRSSTPSVMAELRRRVANGP